MKIVDNCGMHDYSLKSKLVQFVFICLGRVECKIYFKSVIGETWALYQRNNSMRVFKAIIYQYDFWWILYSHECCQPSIWASFRGQFLSISRTSQVETYIKRLVLQRRTFKYVTSFCSTYRFFKIPKISIFSPDVRYGQAKNGFTKNYRRNSGFISENDMVETSVLSHYLLLYDFRLLLFQQP